MNAAVFGNHNMNGRYNGFLLAKKTKLQPICSIETGNGSNNIDINGGF